MMKRIFIVVRNIVINKGHKECEIMLIPVQDMNFTIKNTGDFREYSLDEFKKK